jgi:hypothetical protein
MAENDLKDLFQDTGAQTPNVITFTSKPLDLTASSSTAESPDLPPETKKKRKKREPYQRKTPSRSKRKPRVVDDMRDFIVPDSSVLFDPLLAPPPLPSSSSSAEPPKPCPPAGPDPAALEKKLKDKRTAVRNSTFVAWQDQGKSEHDIKAELKRIDQLSEDDLDFEIQKIALRQSKHFSERVALTVRDGMGWVADKLLNKGAGHIQREFESDKALKDALQQRMDGVLNVIGPSSQILLLSVGDIAQGKAKAMTQLYKNNEKEEAEKNNKEQQPQTVIRGSIHDGLARG